MCFPVSNPLSLHCLTISSNISWNIPLSANLSWRFFEKVEWSDTLSSRFNPSNYLYPMCIFTSSHNLRSEVIPYKYPIRSILINTSGSMDEQPVWLYNCFTLFLIKLKSCVCLPVWVGALQEISLPSLHSRTSVLFFRDLLTIAPPYNEKLL